MTKAMELIDVPETKKPEKPNTLTLSAEPIITASQPLNVDEISPSKTNDGRDEEDQSFAELCASVKVHGVLEAIVVRPLWCVGWNGDAATEPADQSAKGYEIIAGERRWRATKKCGHSQIPATIRTMGDAEALEIQAIENAQRKNLNEVQEARAFQRLMADHGYTIDRMVERVGKSKSLIYSRVKLLDAPKSILDAVEKGLLPASTATMVGRIPNRELREKAAKAILDPSELHYPYRTDDGSPMSTRQAKRFIEEQFKVELKGAPFDVKADKLVADVGPCATCPKRAGNLPDFDPKAGGRADVCTDPLCFQAKKEAAVAKVTATFKQEGRRLLTPEEAEKVFDSDGDMSWNSEFVPAAEQPKSYEVKETVKKRPSWKKLATDTGIETVMAISPTGKPVELVRKSAVIAAVKNSKDNIFASHVSGRDTDAHRAEMAKAREKAKLDQATTFEGLSAVWAKTITHRFFGTPGFEDVMLNCCLGHAGHDGRWLLCKWLKLDVKKSGHGTMDHGEALTKHFRALAMDQEREAFLVLLLLSGGMKYSSVRQEDFRAVAKFFNLETSTFVDLAKAKLAEGKKPKAVAAPKVEAAAIQPTLPKLPKRFVTVNGVPKKKGNDFPIKLVKKAKPEKNAPLKKTLKKIAAKATKKKGGK